MCREAAGYVFAGGSPNDGSKDLARNVSTMDLGLKNRVALVAASSQGLGLATAEAFAAEGCRVAMCARNQTTLAAAAEKIRKRYSVEVFEEAFDVGDSAAVARFVAAVAGRLGSVDICVTNAGGPPAKGFLAATLEDWQRALELNFLSTVYFAREVIPHMQRKRWGRIITITSITTTAGGRSRSFECSPRGCGRASQESGQRVRQGREFWSTTLGLVLRLPIG